MSRRAGKVEILDGVGRQRRVAAVVELAAVGLLAVAPRRDQRRLLRAEQRLLELPDLDGDKVSDSDN